MEQSNFHCKNYFSDYEITNSVLNRDDYQVQCVLIYIGLPGIFSTYIFVTKRFMLSEHDSSTDPYLGCYLG